MPQLLGTDFLRSLPNPPKVIFTTAYKEYAVEAFELEAVTIFKTDIHRSFYKGGQSGMRAGSADRR